MAKIFIICPVRNADPAIQEEIQRYIERLEEAGHHVHWPPRDTDQSDPHGIQICMDNFDAILDADRVDVFYDPNSRGSHFDIGMVNALRLLGFKKTVLWVNNFPRAYLPWNYKPFLTVRTRTDELRYCFEPTGPWSLFEGGMLFALLRLGFKRKLVLLNDSGVQPTPEKKSFANVFRALADGRDIAREDAVEILSVLTEEAGE